MTRNNALRVCSFSLVFIMYYHIASLYYCDIPTNVGKGRPLPIMTKNKQSCTASTPQSNNYLGGVMTTLSEDLHILLLLLVNNYNTK